MSEKTVNILITGLSGSGKTLIARAVGNMLKQNGFNVELDDDDFISTEFHDPIWPLKPDRRKIIIETSQF